LDQDGAGPAGGDGVADALTVIFGDGFNLLGILEADLERKLREQARERWLAENRAGMDAYNEQVEKHGVFSDGLRAF
jgi:antitoxin CcdA